MRVLLLSEYFPTSSSAELKGGVESRCFSVARELAKKYDITVITSYQGGDREEYFDGILVRRAGRTHPYSPSGSIRSRLSFAMRAVAAGRRLPHMDIVDGYNFLSYLPAYRLARLHGAKSVATYHDVWAGGEWIQHTGLVTGVLGEVWERAVLSRRWDRLIAVSDFTKQKLEQHGIDPNKVRVVHNGINLRRFAAVRAEKTAHPSVCCVSRLVKYKQVDVLVRAMAQVVREVPDASCSIIGTGDERSSLERNIRELGLEKSISLRGFLPRHEDVIREMKSSWTLAFPSRIEGFGMVAVEAMACGTPHVSSNIPAIAEATGNGKGGFLVAPGDDTALARRIIQLLEDKKLRAKKAQEGREHAAQFDWPLIVRQIEHIYRGLLG